MTAIQTIPYDTATCLITDWLGWLSRHRQPVPHPAYAGRVHEQIVAIILSADPRPTTEAIEFGLRLMAARAYKHQRTLDLDALEFLPTVVSAYMTADLDALDWLYRALEAIAQIETQEA